MASTRRSWSAEKKRAILAEAGEAKTSISDVARRHGIHASLLFRWRRNARDPRETVAAPPALTFVPLAVRAPATRPPVVESTTGRIEIELAGRHRVRIDPEAYLCDVLTRIADHPAQRLTELLPWNWSETPPAALAA